MEKKGKLSFLSKIFFYLILLKSSQHFIQDICASVTQQLM